MLRTLAAMLLLALPCFADDLVLKDGRRIAWKTLTDDGEGYTVETKEGKKLTFKKSEIERVAMGEEPATKPLTGASFTLNPKKTATVDLLPKAKTETTNGAWKSTPGVIESVGENPARVSVPFEFEVPEEYDLSLSIERGKTGNLGFDVGIIQGDSIGTFNFDSFYSAASCFAQISGQFGPRIDGQVFKPGKARIVRIAVRKDAVLVQVDGKDFWKSRLDWKTVTLHGDIPCSDKKKLFLTAAGGPWKVTSFILTYVK